ncbi:hypothetical protein F0562_011818 [Nyssa sinensis]|uniref:Uncharacterized protein n=1 Tax=Nyssa sinensis TaxID=561372 RepID=A0A5J4ZR31_9ASTE|nr:hypothetical protein F0562_011818 [Nyssa sinensis]
MFIPPPTKLELGTESSTRRPNTAITNQENKGKEGQVLNTSFWLSLCRCIGGTAPQTGPPESLNSNSFQCMSSPRVTLLTIQQLKQTASIWKAAIVSVSMPSADFFSNVALAL